MAKPHKITGISPQQDFQTNALIILPQRLEEVFGWEQYIMDPERREELHNMRISVKRLRYTMEFFVVNYDTSFSDLLDIIIDLQDILGDIHDSDVVLDTLIDYKNSCEFNELRGVDTLISRAQNNRNADYETFINIWKKLSETNFKQKLLDIF